MFRELTPATFVPGFPAGICDPFNLINDDRYGGPGRTRDKYIGSPTHSRTLTIFYSMGTSATQEISMDALL
jgi:hypothetical protein